MASPTCDKIEDICNQLAEGKSLRAICREMELKESSVRYWLNKDADAFAHSARARELGCDALADECIEIADDKLEPADVKRIRIDTRIRLIGKWSQRYSEKVTVNSKSEVTHRYDLDILSADKLDQLEAILADAEGGQGGEVQADASSIH